MKHLIPLSFVLLTTHVAFASPNPSCQAIYDDVLSNIFDSRAELSAEPLTNEAFAAKLWDLVHKDVSADQEDLEVLTYLNSVTRSIQESSSTFFRDEALLLNENSAAVKQANDLSEKMLKDMKALTAIVKPGMRPQKLLLLALRKSGEAKVEKLSESIRQKQGESPVIADLIAKEQAKNFRLQRQTRAHDESLGDLAEKIRFASDEFNGALSKGLLNGAASEQVRQIVLPTLEGALVTIASLRQIAEVNQMNLVKRAEALTQAAARTATLPTVSIPLLANQSSRKLDLSPTTKAVEAQENPDSTDETVVIQVEPVRSDVIPSEVLDARKRRELSNQYHWTKSWVERSNESERLEKLRISDLFPSTYLRGKELLELALSDPSINVRKAALKKFAGRREIRDLRYQHFNDLGDYPKLLLFSEDPECRIAGAKWFSRARAEINDNVSSLLNAAVRRERDKYVAQVLRKAFRSVEERRVKGRPRKSLTANSDFKNLELRGSEKPVSGISYPLIAELQTIYYQSATFNVRRNLRKHAEWQLLKTKDDYSSKSPEIYEMQLGLLESAYADARATGAKLLGPSAKNPRTLKALQEAALAESNIVVALALKKAIAQQSP